jgi:hypothetical protein
VRPAILRIRDARLEDAPRLAGLIAQLGYPAGAETIAGGSLGWR